jgi:predicted transcriptional regulator
MSMTYQSGPDDETRRADEAAEEYRQTVAAIKEGNADAEAGRITPVRDLLAKARLNAPTRE